MKFKSCSVAGCNDNARREANGSGGYCSKHYQRLRKHGDLHREGRVAHCQRFIEQHIGHVGDDCVIWPYGLSTNGYPKVSYNGKSVTASSVICEATHGSRPSEQHESAHDCGVRACINPNHIRWKTIQENADDRAVHGTNMYGEKCHTAVLNIDDVKEIRRASGRNMDLAERYGVSPNTISAVRRRVTWARV